MPVLPGGPRAGRPGAPGPGAPSARLPYAEPLPLYRARFARLTAEERTDLLELVGLAERALETEYHPHGMNFGVNVGRVAGAGIPGHLHMHVVPRWDGDTNFMATVGETRVLPESLARTWTRLRRAIRTLERGPDGRRRARGPKR